MKNLYTMFLDENKSLEMKIISRYHNAREPIVLLKKKNQNRNK